MYIYNQNFLLFFLITVFIIFLTGCKSDSNKKYQDAVDKHLDSIDQSLNKPVDEIIYDEDALMERATQKIEILMSKTK